MLSDGGLHGFCDALLHRTLRAVLAAPKTFSVPGFVGMGSPGTAAQEAAAAGLEAASWTQGFINFIQGLKLFRYIHNQVRLLFFCLAYVKRQQSLTWLQFVCLFVCS